MPETLSSVTEQLKKYNSFVCIIAQADFKNQNESSYSVSDSLKMLSAIITRTVCDTYNCCSILCSNDTVITTIYSENTIDSNTLTKMCTLIQDKFHAATSITSSYLIGDIFADSTEIYASLVAIIQFLEFRFLYGYNSIVYQSSLNSDRSAIYPQNIVHDITTSVIHSAPRVCLESMDKFFAAVIYSNSPHIAKEWIASMVFSLIKETQYIYNRSSSNGFDYLKQILDCATIDECILLIQNMLPEIELIRAPAKIQSNEVFKHQVTSIVADEYMNPDMNIAYISEKLNLVPAYFGQKFAKEFDAQFNVYLSNYRINCSMKLLTSTNDKIADIALQCGFSSAAYFTKAFREHTNMTPSQYRAKNQN